MGIQYGVVADDLTGAGDTGVQFALAGLDTMLDLGAVEVDTNVLVITTDSRSLRSEVAARRVREAFRRMHDLGAELIYKKIDSTCRGNLAAETDAALAESEPGSLAVLCPAFPSTGRIVIGGHLVVDRNLVHRTPVGDDPVTPVRDSYIPHLLREMGEVVDRIDIAKVEEGSATIVRELYRLAADGKRAIVVDAVSDAELRLLAQAILETQVPVLPVGSAGLAGALASRLARVTASASDAGFPVVVMGSLHSTSRAQVDMLVGEHGWPAFRLDGTALAENESWNEWLEQLCATASEECGGEGGIVLTTSLENEAVADGRNQAMNHSKAHETAMRLTQRLGQAVMAVTRVQRPSGLVLTGGDTARAVLAEMQATGLLLTGQVVPGMPVARIVGGQLPDLVVVTKAGGFGGPDVLWQAAQYIRQTTATHRGEA